MPKRCTWAEGNELMSAYHDQEWGVPERDSRALWEKLMLDGFQAGLSWLTILKKRDSLSRSVCRLRSRESGRLHRAGRCSAARKPRHRPLPRQDRSHDWRRPSLLENGRARRRLFHDGVGTDRRRTHPQRNRRGARQDAAFRNDVQSAQAPRLQIRGPGDSCTPGCKPWASSTTTRPIASAAIAFEGRQAVVPRSRAVPAMMDQLPASSKPPGGTGAGALGAAGARGAASTAVSVVGADLKSSFTGPTTRVKML